jgi:hypothetical protein
MFHFLIRVMLGSCCAGALLTPLTAEARPAESANAAASAALVDQGIELRRQGKDAEALDVFKQAVLLHPDSVRALIHVATCYQAVGDWVAADAHLRRALEHTSDPYVERHKQALENAQRVIAERLGMLEVGGGPAGAVVLLNGQRMGQLPLSEPIRATVGDYLLEVKMPGHYPTSRPVSIKSRTLVREDVQLASAGARSSEAFAAGSASSLGSTSGMPSEDGTPAGPEKTQWLTWTLGGLGGAAAVTALTALIVRNSNAQHWNDDGRCLNVPGRTRQELCGDERDSAKTAENVALVGGTAAIFLGAGALLSSFIANRSEQPEANHLGFLGGCTLSPEGASCRGSF